MIPRFTFYRPKRDKGDSLGIRSFVNINLTETSGMNFDTTGFMWSEETTRVEIMDQMPLYICRRAFGRVVDPRELKEGEDYVWTEDQQ